jgi:hypothetical protein
MARAMDGTPKPTLVFDIEVAGFAWEEVDEITRNYLVSREKDPKHARACPSARRSTPASAR